MPQKFIIRIKALFLLAVFAGNFFGVCHCSAAMVDSTHCCCHKTAQPCKETSNCAGTQAVKFNLLEKKAAATVCLNPVDAILVPRDFVVPAVEGRLAQRNASSWYLPPHAPPDRLALFQCYLI